MIRGNSEEGEEMWIWFEDVGVRSGRDVEIGVSCAEGDVEEEAGVCDGEGFLRLNSGSL